MTNRNIIGIDVGGTKIAAGVVAFPEGRLLTRQTIPTNPQRSGEQILTDVEEIVGSFSSYNAAGIGVGLCEIVDTNYAIASECSIHWRHLPVRERLEKFAPCLLEADVRAAALGEALFGAGNGTSCFLYVTIGTGISSCLIIGGEPYRGASGATGTMASGPLPHFESTQTLEQIASGPGIVATFNARGGRASSAEDVFAAAASGDACAQTVLENAARLLGGTIGWMINILDPEKLILGGGIGILEGSFRHHLVDALRAHIWWPAHRQIEIRTARGGADAGIIGAAAAAWKRFQMPE